MSDIGHNSGSYEDDGAKKLDAAAKDLLLGIERVERLMEERKGINDDIKDVFSEYKAKGYDVNTMRRIIALRKMKPDDRREMEALLQTYMSSLGME